MTLLECADSAATDRVWHGYLTIYEKLIGHRRHEPVTIMEQGFLGGGGLEMWAKYFTHPDTRIWGIDIHDRGYRPTDLRVVLRFGSNADTNFMRGTYAESGPLDLVAEDASHMASHQIQSFIDGWPFIKHGGTWVTEDLHVCHSTIHRDAHVTFIEYCAKLAAEAQDPRGAEGCGAYDPTHLHSDIDSITLRKGLAIIRKRA